MNKIIPFKLFESYEKKIVFRGLKREFDENYDEVQYYAENRNYARVFGSNIKAFYIELKDVMDLDEWNNKLSKETQSHYDGHLFTVHSTYLYKESENYGYRGLRDMILVECGKEEFYNFQRAFNNAKIVKGRDSGNESQIVYAVRDNSLITPLEMIKIAETLENTYYLYSVREAKTSTEFMSDLYNVGITKSVGYLPYDNIRIYGNDSVDNVILWSNQNNLRHRHFSSSEGSTGSGGAFYVYDYNMLQDILTKYSDILVDAGIPTEPDDYIDYIEKNTVYNHLYPEAYKVIGYTFNDKRFV